MIKKTLNLSLIGLSVLASSVFAENLSFTGAQLNGNFTRTNFEKFSKVKFDNPKECKMSMIFVATRGNLPGDPKNDGLMAGTEETTTREVLLGLDEVANMMNIGKFQEFQNDPRYPIPDCANNAVFTFSE